MSLSAESSSLTKSFDLSSLLKERAELAQALRRRLDTNKLRDYEPHPRQLEFHNAGKEHGERLFMAGNQLGKTWGGGFETAVHLTGRYPDWWQGAEFLKPTKFWVSGVSGESTRDNPQRILLGPPQKQDDWGTGAIPKECIVDHSPSRGVADAVDSAVIKWGGGGDVQAGESILLFKSYEKGRQKWQGDTIDGGWFDEEPPMDIYSEGRTRTQKGQRGYFTLITFTPLLGMSEVVRMFLRDGDISAMQAAA